MKLCKRSLGFAALALSLSAVAAVAEAVDTQRNVFAERGFTHILGPNPALTPNSDKSAFDSWILESCDVFKDENTYYWYYHAKSNDKTKWPRSYRLGVATAPMPLGPWKRHEKNPILDHGPAGSWDETSVDGAKLLKQSAWDIRHRDSKYYMFYSGSGKNGRHIGFATSSSPLGPWKKYENNPVVRDFGYLSGVVKVNGKYYLYAQCPTSASGVSDQGPFRLATADKPEGPWTKYKAGPEHGVCGSAPVISPGEWGSWDDGGYSEARVLYNEGIFHLFYGGTKSSKLESIGYAYSFDGINWTKYAANPVVSLSRVPDSSGLAEVHAYMEGPNVYLYHTLRYFTGKGTARGLPSTSGGRGGWLTEDLGIQVLTIDPRFKFAMPVLSKKSMEPKTSSRIEECVPIGLESASSLALTVETAYDAGAKAGLRLHVRASADGVTFDTADLNTFDIPFAAGETVRKTVELSPNVKYVKVVVRNLDESKPAKSINVTATLGNS